VILALHGMNDSRDAWEYAAPAFAAAGIIVISPDLRGFGASPSRGFWPGTDRLVDDTREELGQIRARYPRSPIVGMAESMGAAILMVMATRSAPTDGAGAEVDRYVLLAPAVWGRSEMNIPMRALLWMMNGIAPGLRLTNGSVVKVTASDNRAALVRLSTDPLTLHATRVDAVKGLVDLMDAAQDAAPHLPPSAMVLYGGHDELIPPAAMRAAWQSMPTDVVRAFYPDGYHLLLRDNGRNATIADILSWLRDPCAPLPSGAEAAARAWLQTDIDRDAH